MILTGIFQAPAFRAHFPDWFGTTRQLIALPHTAAGYDPRHWGMVFPLGMYAASTDRLAAAAGLDVVAPISRLFLPVAVLAWVAVAIGLLRRGRTRLARALG